MGLRPHGEAQGGGHRGGALEARKGQPRQGAGVPHPLLPLGYTVGGEDAPDVDIRRSVGPGPRVTGGAAGRRDLEPHWPSAVAEARRDGGGKTHTVQCLDRAHTGMLLILFVLFLCFLPFSLILVQSFCRGSGGTSPGRTSLRDQRARPGRSPRRRRRTPGRRKEPRRFSGRKRRRRRLPGA